MPHDFTFRLHWFFIHTPYKVVQPPVYTHTHTHTHTRLLVGCPDDSRIIKQGQAKEMHTHTHTRTHTHTHAHTDTHTHRALSPAMRVRSAMLAAHRSPADCAPRPSWSAVPSLPPRPRSLPMGSACMITAHSTRHGRACTARNLPPRLPYSMSGPACFCLLQHTHRRRHTHTHAHTHNTQDNTLTFMSEGTALGRMSVCLFGLFRALPTLAKSCTPTHTHTHMHTHT